MQSTWNPLHSAHFICAVTPSLLQHLTRPGTDDKCKVVKGIRNVWTARGRLQGGRILILKYTKSCCYKHTDQTSSALSWRTKLGPIGDFKRYGIQGLPKGSISNEQTSHTWVCVPSFLCPSQSSVTMAKMLTGECSVSQEHSSLQLLAILPRV